MDDFDQLWSAFPRKTAKVVARRAFKKASKKTTLADMLDALEVHKHTEQWQRGVIPHLSTWLNQERWADEVGIVLMSPRITRALEALDDDIRIARRRDELLRQGKSRAEVSAILEQESV